MWQLGFKKSYWRRCAGKMRCSFYTLNSGLENREQVDAAMDQFATGAAIGSSVAVEPILYPGDCNMKSTPVDTIVKLTRDVRESLQQKGCNSYEIGYYLIYDQKVEKNNLEQIVSVLQEENTSCHIGIFSKNMEEAYAHVIRAIAMDLFLKLYGERRPYKYIPWDTGSMMWRNRD
ncbi:MAG: hypothetical protein V8S98_03840 [Lachnospiraceae bacterium]